MADNEHDDEQARIERARKLRETVQQMTSGGRAARPRTPRDFTDERAREAAEEERAREAAAEERERLEGSGEDD
jgi:hypothetical protein